MEYMFLIRSLGGMVVHRAHLEKNNGLGTKEEKLPKEDPQRDMCSS